MADSKELEINSLNEIFQPGELQTPYPSVPFKYLKQLINLIPREVSKKINYPSVINLGINSYKGNILENVSWEEMKKSPSLDQTIPLLLKIFPSLKILTYYPTQLPEVSSQATFSLPKWIKDGLQKLELPSSISHLRIIFDSRSLHLDQYNTNQLSQNKKIFVVNCFNRDSFNSDTHSYEDKLDHVWNSKNMIDIFNINKTSFIH